MKHLLSASEQLSDEVLCARAVSGDREAEEVLVVRYNRLVRSCARPYFLAGGDGEDLIQEGMVGLLSAIREYDPGKETAFRTYAEVCIRNRLLSAIRATVQASESRICRLLFKIAVEQDMTMNVLAAGMEIPQSQLDRLRPQCVQHVKKTGGSVLLDDAVERQRRTD